MENTKFMTMEDIINLITELSYSQGFYGRLLRDIREMEEYDPDRYAEFCEYMENQMFSEPLDVVFFFEC